MVTIDVAMSLDRLGGILLRRPPISAEVMHESEGKYGKFNRNFKKLKLRIWKHMDFSLISNFSQRIEHSISRTLTSKLFMTS